jgi:hypothetical protein
MQTIRSLLLFGLFCVPPLTCQCAGAAEGSTDEEYAYVHCVADLQRVPLESLKRWVVQGDLGTSTEIAYQNSKSSCRNEYQDLVKSYIGTGDSQKIARADVVVKRAHSLFFHNQAKTMRGVLAQSK